jgi:hypothetical protein
MQSMDLLKGLALYKDPKILRTLISDGGKQVRFPKRVSKKRSLWKMSKFTVIFVATVHRKCYLRLFSFLLYPVRKLRCFMYVVLYI